MTHKNKKHLTLIIQQVNEILILYTISPLQISNP